MAGFGEQLQAAAPMFLGIGSQLSGRDPAGIARGVALLQAQQERDKRKAAIDNMLSGMGIAGPEKAFLESMPLDMQQAEILRRMQPQEPMQPLPPGLFGDGGGFNFDPYLTGGGTREDAISGLDGSFRGAVGQMIADAPPEIQQQLRITSAFRSPDVQTMLFERAIKTHGSPEAARKWVAPPGKSRHNHGQAIDFTYLSPEAQQYVHANAERYGLHFPMAHEPWHVEPIGSRGGGQPVAPQQTSKQSVFDTQIGTLTRNIDAMTGLLGSGWNIDHPAARDALEYKRKELEARRDALIERQKEAAESAKPKIVKGADGYNYWVAPGQTPQRVLPEIEGEPDDEYGRYVEEEVAAGREPLSRIDFKRAGQKSMRVRTSPDGSTTVEEVFGGEGVPDLTVDAAKNTGFLIRTKESNAILDEFDRQGTDFWQTLANDKGGRLGNYVLTPEFQKFDQAKRDFVNAILRRESGAVISPAEFANAEKQYFPVPGDSDEVIAQKRQNRRTAIDGLRVGSGAGAAYVEGQPTVGAGGEGSQAQPDPTVDLQGADLELFGKYGVPIGQ